MAHKKKKKKTKQSRTAWKASRGCGRRKTQKKPECSLAARLSRDHYGMQCQMAPREGSAQVCGS
jgi:hypothetical protein